jgi:hypothetical protein
MKDKAGFIIFYFLNAGNISNKQLICNFPVPSIYCLKLYLKENFGELSNTVDEKQ